MINGMRTGPVIGLAAGAGVMLLWLWPWRRPSTDLPPVKLAAARPLSARVQRGLAVLGADQDGFCAQESRAAPGTPSQEPAAVSPESMAVKAAACEAVAAQDPGVCSVLDNASARTSRPGGWANPTDRTDCLLEYWDFSTMKAMARGNARAPEFCAEFFAAQASFDPAAIARLCGLYVAAFRTGVTGDLCRTLTRSLRWPATEEARREYLRWCEAHTAGVIGDEARCAGAPEPWSASYCRDKHALFAAARSRDSGPCQGSPMCSAALARRASECRPLWTDLRRAVCRAEGPAGPDRAGRGGRAAW